MTFHEYVTLVNFVANMSGLAVLFLLIWFGVKLRRGQAKLKMMYDTIIDLLRQDSSLVRDDNNDEDK